MKVAVLPEVTSGWHGIDVTTAEAALWPDEFDTCPVCGGRFRPEGARKYCSLKCTKRAAHARERERKAVA